MRASPYALRAARVNPTGADDASAASSKSLSDRMGIDKNSTAGSNFGSSVDGMSSDAGAHAFKFDRQARIFFYFFGFWAYAAALIVISIVHMRVDWASLIWLANYGSNFPLNTTATVSTSVRRRPPPR